MQEDKTENLIKMAKKQNSNAFTELMQLYMKDMYRVAVAILMNDEDTADAIQDTILTCWEKIPRLKQEDYFRTWLTRILINKCYDIRRKRGELWSFDECDEPASDDGYNVELKEALSTISENYRIVLTLFYSEGYHIEEIAKILKVPKSTVQTRLKRAREALAKNYYKE